MRRGFCFPAILGILALVGVAAEIAYVLNSPEVPLLPPRPGGSWVRRSYTRNLYIHRDVDTVGYFRKDFVTSAPPSDIEVAITAFRSVAVFLDGEPLPLPTVSSWKDPIRLTVPGRRLIPGTHQLGLIVTNRMGPPLFHVSSSRKGLQDLEGWESSGNGIDWRPALRGDEKLDAELRTGFPTVSDGLRRSLPLVLPLFLGTLILVVLKPGFTRRIASPSSVRFAISVLWIILGVNDAPRHPLAMGFDVVDHLDYVMFIHENHRLPLASDGLQMFQPPLYYLLSAILYGGLQLVLQDRVALLLLKAVPLACAIVLVEITYRMLRELFPDREDLQSCGLLVGGLLPMNLYMCQYYGNEPLTAVLTALLLLKAVRLFRRTGDVPARDVLILGGLAGLAILTKFTPVILIPVVFAFLLAGSRGKECGPATGLKTGAVFLLVAGIVAGWFYARNWIAFGKPFLGGWDPARGITWWQDPGFRTASDFFSFGEALRQPVYAAFNGFWDAMYSTFWSDGYLSASAEYWSRPRWNYALLAAGTGLSIFPASMIAAGVLLAVRHAGKEESRPFTFLVVSIAAYLAALVHLFAVLPIYSTAKASYTMGLTPCYAATAALGAGYLSRIPYVRVCMVSLLVTWALTTYAGFFVVH